MAVSIIGPKFYAWDSDTGKPLAFGKVYTYQAGTNTPKATFTTEGGETENANPVILNGAGYADIYLNGSYKIVVKDADDVEVWTSDPVSDPSQLQQEWVRQRNITQVNTTTFTVDGELTDEYVKGVAVRVKQDSGFVTGTVASATYADGKTTVTLDFPGTETITTSAVYAERALVSFQSLPKNLGNRTIYVGSVAELEALSLPVGTNVRLTDPIRFGEGTIKSGTAPDDPLKGRYITLANGNYWDRDARDGEISPSWYGVEPSLADTTFFFDGQAALFGGKNLTIDSGSYNIDKAFALISGNHKIVGLGDVEFVKSIDGAGAYFSWKEQGVYENITVRSTLPDVPQIRTVVKNNAILRNCNVFDNKHNDGSPEIADAWGFYFKDCSGATLYDCGASGNTQSDFTIVDNVHNVLIINGTDGGHGQGCKLNIEPNSQAAGGVDSLLISGGKYTLVTVIEPFKVGIAINGVKFDSCEIDEFVYQGGSVRVSNCVIGNLQGLVGSTSSDTGRAGQLTSDSIMVGPNLIEDPAFADISRDDTRSYWTVVTSNLPPTDRYSRIEGVSGVFTRLNPLEQSGTYRIGLREKIPTSAGAKFAITAKTRKKQNELIPSIVSVDFFDATDTLIVTKDLWFNKSDVLGITDITTETAIFECPAGTASLRVGLGRSGTSTSYVDVFGIGLFQLDGIGVEGAPLDDRIAEVESAGRSVRRQDHFPENVAGYYYPESFLGERIINSAPAAGAASEWRCVSAGRPGTWKALTLDA
ncbi:hypothetical protein [Alcanivorax jadensis]|uniref:hypothetical protein n=1 Tax=Alcanivorax jadensis TaxID=64988 RepID=UPI0023566DE8|nr:hypothetical protein [Alcanivorax jadensis]|tara:strand:- start:1880 stop:4156 length:2277 start_codon:yes stop_codon:yes gene_type:complete